MKADPWMKAEKFKLKKADTWLSVDPLVKGQDKRRPQVKRLPVERQEPVVLASARTPCPETASVVVDGPMVGSTLEIQNLSSLAVAGIAAALIDGELLESEECVDSAAVYASGNWQRKMYASRQRSRVPGEMVNVRQLHKTLAQQSFPHQPTSLQDVHARVGLAAIQRMMKGAKSAPWVCAKWLLMQRRYQQRRPLGVCRSGCVDRGGDDRQDAPLAHYDGTPGLRQFVQEAQCEGSVVADAFTQGHASHCVRRVLPECRGAAIAMAVAGRSWSCSSRMRLGAPPPPGGPQHRR